MSVLASVEFKRIVFEEWALVIVIVSFALVGLIFLIGSVRALLLPKGEREHLANLPLEGDKTSEPPPQDSTSPPKQP